MEEAQRGNKHDSVTFTAIFRVLQNQANSKAGRIKDQDSKSMGRMIFVKRDRSDQRVTRVNSL